MARSPCSRHHRPHTRAFRPDTAPVSGWQRPAPSPPSHPSLRALSPPAPDSLTSASPGPASGTACRQEPGHPGDSRIFLLFTSFPTRPPRLRRPTSGTAPPGRPPAPRLPVRELRGRVVRAGACEAGGSARPGAAPRRHGPRAPAAARLPPSVSAGGGRRRRGLDKSGRRAAARGVRPACAVRGPPNLSPPRWPRRLGEGRSRGPAGGSAGRGRGSPPASSAARAPSGARRVPAAPRAALSPRGAGGSGATRAPGPRRRRRPSLPPSLRRRPLGERVRAVGVRLRLQARDPRGDGGGRGVRERGRARRAGRERGRPGGPEARPGRLGGGDGWAAGFPLPRAASRKMQAGAGPRAGEARPGHPRRPLLRSGFLPARRPGLRFRGGGGPGRVPAPLAARAPSAGPEPPAQGPAAEPVLEARGSEWPLGTWNWRRPGFQRVHLCEMMCLRLQTLS